MSRHKFSKELRERAVRTLNEMAPDYPSHWAAVRAISSQMGCSPATLRKWAMQRNEAFTKQLEAPISAETRLKELEEENRNLRRSNEILRLAAAIFAQSEYERSSSFR